MNRSESTKSMNLGECDWQEDNDKCYSQNDLQSSEFCQHRAMQGELCREVREAVPDGPPLLPTKNQSPCPGPREINTIEIQQISGWGRGGNSQTRDSSHRYSETTEMMIKNRRTKKKKGNKTSSMKKQNVCNKTAQKSERSGNKMNASNRKRIQKVIQRQVAESIHVARDNLSKANHPPTKSSKWPLASKDVVVSQNNLSEEDDKKALKKGNQSNKKRRASGFVKFCFDRGDRFRRINIQRDHFGRRSHKDLEWTTCGIECWPESRKNNNNKKDRRKWRRVATEKRFTVANR